MHLPSDPVPDEKYWHKDIKMYVSNTQVTNFFSYKRYVHFWQFHKQSFIFAGYLHRFTFGPLSQKCVALLKTTSRFWKIENNLTSSGISWQATDKNRRYRS